MFNVLGIVVLIIGFSGIKGDIEAWKNGIGRMLEWLDKRRLRPVLIIVALLWFAAIWIPPWSKWLAPNPSISIEESESNEGGTIYTVKDNGVAVKEIIVPPHYGLEISISNGDPQFDDSGILKLNTRGTSDLEKMEQWLSRVTKFKESLSESTDEEYRELLKQFTNYAEQNWSNSQINRFNLNDRFAGIPENIENSDLAMREIQLATIAMWLNTFIEEEKKANLYGLGEDKTYGRGEDKENDD